MLIQEIKEWSTREEIGDRNPSPTYKLQEMTCVPTRATTLVLPDWSGQAVLDGCAQLGLDNSLIVTRKSKYTYGIEADQVFDSSIHSEEECVFENDMFLVKSIFQIYVRTNESVPFDQQVSKTYTIPPNISQLKIQLLKSVSKNPQKAGGDLVGKLATILVDCPLSDKKQLINVSMAFGKSEIVVTAETPDGIARTVQANFD